MFTNESLFTITRVHCTKFSYSIDSYGLTSKIMNIIIKPLIKIRIFFRFGGTGGLLGNDTDSLGSEWSLSERERFDDVMETILIELESVCHDEQQFSIKFFKMDQISTNKDNTRNVQDAKKAKVAMEEARNMMAESFPTLDNELLHFISAYEKADSFFTLHALVR